jgi:hypothetical protein
MNSKHQTNKTPTPTGYGYPLEGVSTISSKNTAM